MLRFRALLGAATVGACAVAGLQAVASAAPTAPSSAPAAVTSDSARGTYYPVSPARLMDTRTGLGGRTGKVGPDSSVRLQVTGRGGVPADGVGAVVLNVTVTGPTASSFLTVFPAGRSRPTASSVNFPQGWLGSNNVTSMLGSAGDVTIYNRAGHTHVVVDVLGFYAGADTGPGGLGPGGQFRPLAPVRLHDSRTDHRGALPAGAALNNWVDFDNEFGMDDYNRHVRALVLNITAVGPQRDGFLTAWTGGEAVPNISTVNYRAGKVVPNLAYVKTQPCPPFGCGVDGAPRYMIYSSATTHLVVDLVGVIDDGTVPGGLRFSPAVPNRIVDSRIGQGLSGPLGTAQTGRVEVSVTDPTRVLVMNVTGVAPERNTVLTVWADGVAKPTASNLNPEAGQIVSNGVLGVLSPEGAFQVHNLTGRTHVVADVVGTFHLDPATASGTSGESLVRVAGSGVSGHVR